jgi:hypothetical protein
MDTDDLRSAAIAFDSPGATRRTKTMTGTGSRTMNLITLTIPFENQFVTTWVL